MHSSLGRLYRNRGVLLVAFGVVATLWLRATGQLNLYIHPRYYLFSVVMSVVGLAAIIFSTQNSKHKHHHSPPSRNVAVSLTIVLIAFAMLIIIKPASLSSDIASQRGVNSGANTDAITKLNDIDVVSPFGNNSTNQLSVRDWSNLLSQTSDNAFFAGKQATVLGFITPGDNKDTFYVSRFVVSCCTVDARPIGVPVYKPNWQKTYQNNQWLEVSGVFQVKDGQVAIHPENIKQVDKPKDEYVY